MDLFKILSPAEVRALGPVLDKMDEEESQRRAFMEALQAAGFTLTDSETAWRYNVEVITAEYSRYIKIRYGKGYGLHSISLCTDPDHWPRVQSNYKEVTFICTENSRESVITIPLSLDKNCWL